MTVVLAIVLVWVLMASAVGLLARLFQRRPRWFLVSLIGSPPIGLACLLALGLTDPDRRFDVTPRAAVVLILAAAALVIAVRLYKGGYIRLAGPELEGERALAHVAHVAHVAHAHSIPAVENRGVVRGVGQSTEGQSWRTGTTTGKPGCPPQGSACGALGIGQRPTPAA